MEQLNNVEKDVQKVASNFEQFYGHYGETISTLLADAARLKESANFIEEGSLQIDQQDSSISSENCRLKPDAVRDFLKRVKQVTSQLANEHKELHGSVSKLGKCIDKNFVSEDSLLLAEGYFQPAERRTLLDRAIVDHLVRHGMLDVATSYTDECGLNTSRKVESTAAENVPRKVDVRSNDTSRRGESGLNTLRENATECGSSNELLENEKITQFARIHAICGSLREHRLDEALAWCAEHRTRLTELGSLLEFELHRLAFVELLRNSADSTSQVSGDLLEPIRYARRIANALQQLRDEVLASPNGDVAMQKRRLVAAGERELQTLMGTLLYAQRGLEHSPYAYLLDPIRWTEVQTRFVRDACRLLGVAPDSPLQIAVEAGCEALPPLVTIRAAMQSKRLGSVWTQRDELPVEIRLEDSLRFHSIFACPILRQETTEANPPMRLACGHAISQDALTRLVSGNKIKCPYCPTEQDVLSAKQLHF